MGVMKDLNQHLKRRGALWHYVRRGPKAYELFDNRGTVYKSLKTESLELARARRDALVGADIRDNLLEMALDIPELSPRELAVRFTDNAYFVFESSVYRLLKAHDLISSPAFIVMKAASEFRDKTTAINQMSLSFTAIGVHEKAHSQTWELIST